MPRAHKRQAESRPYADYSNSALENAIREIKQGNISIRAAEKYSVNRCTFNRKIKGVHMQPYGRPPALSEEEETRLLKGKNLPGEDWCRSFIKRHRNTLGIRLNENIKHSRAQVSVETVKEYFINLNVSIQDIPPELIVN